jgi:hypothetical protein
MKVRLISEPRSDSFQLDLPSFSDARVVELVDTRGSGPRARKGLQVQVLSRVPSPPAVNASVGQQYSNQCGLRSVEEWSNLGSDFS